tara:strand:- start:4054 stop:4317 length:264 start_codon:yes stop_codon:yes gene_type:complete
MKNIFKTLGGWIASLILFVVLLLISINFWESKMYSNGNPFAQGVIVLGGPILGTYIVRKLISSYKKGKKEKELDALKKEVEELKKKQ